LRPDPVLRDDALQRDDVAAAALAGSGDFAERPENGAIGGETKLAGGRRRGALEPEFTGRLDGMSSAGRGRGKGIGCAAAPSPITIPIAITTNPSFTLPASANIAFFSRSPAR
jgi:hypothetical protein